MSAAASLRRIADDVADTPGRVLPRAVAEVVTIATDEARRVTGDGRMSGMGRRGPRLRAVPDQTRTTGTRTTVTVRGVPAGPWAILNTGAGPHLIRPRGRGRVMAGALRHPVSTPVRHGGSPPTRVWHRVADRAGRAVPPLFVADIHRAVR